MLLEIKITNEDIQYAEKLLLKEGQSFDEERRIFIKDLSTLDLQAVPGSGKTTALLAKLIILEKKMPFVGNSGILVISHTNAAVDEIYSRIGKYAPKLFQYPNFVGTIQSFVNQFLAIPFYQNQFKRKPYRIDNEIYYERVGKCLKELWFYKFGINNDITKKIGYIKNVDESLFYNYRFQSCENKIILVTKLNSNELEIKKPRGRTKKSNYVDYSKNEKENLKKWFFEFKMFLLGEGILHFDDSYFLADCYLDYYPNIKNILQKRFRYVFVDEMQDMDIHQYKNLEDIFYTDNSLTIFQRIGDINQAIYNGSNVHTNNIWTKRDKKLQINGSYRLNKNIAPIVEKLGLDYCAIEGLNKNSDDSEIDIKAKLIVFDDNTKVDVLAEYAEIIKILETCGDIPNDIERSYIAIAWRKEHDDHDKLGLSDYYSDYLTTDIKTKIDFDVLYDYILFFDQDNQTLEPLRKQILNAILKVLRLEDIKDGDGRYFSIRRLFNHLRENHFKEYEKLKLNLYQWSIHRVNNDLKEVYESIKKYIPQLLTLFDKQIVKTKVFVEDKSERNLTHIQETRTIGPNIYKKDEVSIRLGTIHSVKGQTHTATLYLETFYDRGYGNYESERLRNQFAGECISETVTKLTSGLSKVQQSAKMAYVGLSRSTHLLCFAVHKDRYEKYLTDIDLNLWDVISINRQEGAC